MKRAGVLSVLAALTAVLCLGDFAEAGGRHCGGRRAHRVRHNHCCPTTCCVSHVATCCDSCSTCSSCDSCGGAAHPATLPPAEGAPAPEGAVAPEAAPAPAPGSEVPPPPAPNPTSTELRGQQP